MNTKEFEFTNEFGKPWQLELDIAERIGTFTGDELGDDQVLIADDEFLSDLILSKGERQ
jgi:hypothetical protein